LARNPDRLSKQIREMKAFSSAYRHGKPIKLI
jgi:hypothetical protein